MSNVSTEQFEYLLSMVGKQTVTQDRLAAALERIAASLEDAAVERADSAWVRANT